MPFAAIGLLTLALAVRAIGRGEPVQQIVLLVCVSVAFGGFGFGLILAALRGGPVVEAAAAAQRRHPRQPWLWNPEWAGRRIVDNARGSSVVLWLFALVWTAISTPVLFVVPRELESGNLLVLLALVFPVVGVLLLIAAAYKSLQATRFRETAFVLETLPAPPGGQLRGRVEIPLPGADFSASRVNVRLTCVRIRRSGDDTTESVLWQEELELPASAIQRVARGVSIPIAISIPADASEASETESANRVVWRLHVEAELPGVDYSGTFVVPVFRASADDAAPAPLRKAAAPPSLTIAQRQTAAGTEFIFESFRARGAAMALLCFTALWLGAIALMIHLDTPLFFTIVFSLFAILLVILTLELLFARSVVIATRDALRIRRTLLLYRSDRVIPARDVQSVQTSIGMQASGRPYYDIQVVLRNGKTVVAGRHIRNKREAEWLASRMGEIAGVA